jgi:small subunit ribosomal protein S8
MNLSTLQALNQIKNGSRQKLTKVDVKKSVLLEKLLGKLHADGFIYSYEKLTKHNFPHRSFFRIQLKYMATGDKSRGLLDQMDLPTTLTKNKILKTQSLSYFHLNAYGLVSTPKGILTTIEAKRMGIGGLIFLSIRV